MKLSTAAGAVLALALPLCAAGAAHAEDAATQGTLEVGYTRANFQADGLPDFGFNTIHVRGAMQFNKNWGGELELGFGVGSDTIAPGVDLKQQTEAGIYIDGYVPMGANGELIGRVGWSRSVIKVSALGTSTDGESKGPAVGVGYRYFPNGGVNGVRVDYTHYFYDDDVSANAFSIGYVRKF